VARRPELIIAHLLFSQWLKKLVRGQSAKLKETFYDSKQN